MKRESRTPEGFVHMKTIEEMEEVNIYSDVSGQRPRPPSPVKKKKKTPRPVDLFFYTSLSVYRFG